MMATNGPRTTEQRLHSLEESSAQHDFAMGKVAAFEAHLVRFENKLDGQGDDIRKLSKLVERLAGRASTADELVDEAARAALGLAKRKPVDSKARQALAVKVVLAVLTLLGTLLAGRQLAPPSSSPPTHTEQKGSP